MHTTVYVNDPSGALLDRVHGGTYELPFIAEEVLWSDIENILGTGGLQWFWWNRDWALAVKGEPSSPRGTVDATDDSLTFEYYEDATTVTGRKVYSWFTGYSWAPLLTGHGLNWETHRHSLGLYPNDKLSFQNCCINHLNYRQNYRFEMKISRDGWLWSTHWDVPVGGLSAANPHIEDLWAKDIFDEKGEYTITLELWD